MTITVEQLGHVRHLIIDRPEAANAIDVGTALEIARAIGEFATAQTARVLVVSGMGDRSFCAGGDLTQLLGLTRHEQADRAGPLGFARLHVGKPTIAAVNGYCYGGGLELAVWCDFRVAAQNARFGALNRRWGVPLIDGGTQRLPRIVGYGNAMWMINTGCVVDAKTALRIGLVQEIVPRGGALDHAQQLAQEMSNHPQSALLADRFGVVASSDLRLDEGIEFETRVGRPVMDEPDVVRRLEQYRGGRR